MLLVNMHAWAVPLKDKKDITIINAFQKFLDDSNQKLNKIWLIQVVNFTIDLHDLISHGYKIMI